MAKGIYVGVTTEISQTQETTVNITGSNISNYFTVSNNSYYFKWNSSTNAFESSNSGYSSTTSSSTWTALNDIPNLSFTYSYASEANFDKFTLTVAGTTVANALSGASTVKTWSGSLTKGQTIVMKYSKDGSANSNGDICKIYNISFKTIIQGDTIIKDVARKVKAAYIGINNVARRIKKIYMGVNNVARCIFFDSRPQIAYYGTATDLSSLRYCLAGASVGNYALFAGGNYKYEADYKSTVDAYNSSLTRSTPTALSVARSELSGGSIGNYALFAGGSNGGSASNSQSRVDAYNSSLTRSTPTALSVARSHHSSTPLGSNYILFGGGMDSSGGSTTAVDAYNTSLTRSIPSSLNSDDGFGISSAPVGNYAIFAGGCTTIVNAYDSSLTQSTISPLTYPIRYGRGSYVGDKDYAIFAGGENVDEYDHVALVEVYDKSLTKSLANDISVARGSYSATHLGGFALFAGGFSNVTYDACANVDIFDKSLTRKNGTDLNIARSDLAGASVGNYALFAGGSSGYGVANVDVYLLTQG